MPRWIWLNALIVTLIACDDGATNPRQELQVDRGASDGGASDGGARDAGGRTADGGDAGGGDAGGADAGATEVDPCAPSAGALWGSRYTDTDGSDQSYYLTGAGPDEPPAALPVRVIGATGPVEVRTCAGGRYVTEPLPDGVYLSWAEIPEGRRCASRNCPGRFARAVEAGEVTIVTFGDSIPVVGDPPMFPARVATLLGALATVDERNVAVAGSTSDQWLPGARHFARRLGPHLADADLILISLGGNDILGYVNNPALLSDIPAAVEGARGVVLEVIANLEQIISAIRVVNPDADIAYVLYADYSQATEDRFWGLVGRVLGRETVQGILHLAREAFPDDLDPHLLLVDMFAAADGLPLGDFLYDQLHFNDAGQQLYAESVFESLGGALVGESPLGPGGSSPLGLRRDFALAPESP